MSQIPSDTEREHVNWPRWYAIVIVSHIIVIVLMYLFTLAFHA